MRENRLTPWKSRLVRRAEHGTCPDFLATSFQRTRSPQRDNDLIRVGVILGVQYAVEYDAIGNEIDEKSRIAHNFVPKGAVH